MMISSSFIERNGITPGQYLRRPEQIQAARDLAQQFPTLFEHLRGTHPLETMGQMIKHRGPLAGGGFHTARQI